MFRRISRLTSHLIVVSLLIGASVASAQTASDGRLPSARTSALGGAHAAHETGFEALFSNPASLDGARTEFSIADLTVQSTGPVFTLAGLALQVFGGTEFTTLLASPDVQRLLSSLYARFTLAGPLAFGYVGGGMGFGIYNVSDVLLRSDPSGLEMRVAERILLRGGYGLGIPIPDTWGSRLSVGLGVKGFVRGDVVVGTTLLELASFIGSLGPDTLAGSRFELVTGLGVDVGVLYLPIPSVSVALTVDDLYTPTAALAYDSFTDFVDGADATEPPSYATLPQRVNLGAAWDPNLGPVGRYVDHLRLMLDYRDILDFVITPATAENIVLKFGLGVEARLLEILALRVGFNQGLLAAGLGLDLSFVELNASMFGSELSREPGLRPQYNLVIGLEFHR